MPRSSSFLSFLWLAAGLGCSANTGDESFIIRSVLAVAPGGECSVTPSANSLSLPRGQLFLGSPVPYLVHPLLESRITAADGKDSAATIFIEGARVDLQIGPIDIVDSNGLVTTDSEIVTIQHQSLFSTPLGPNGGLASGQFDLVPVSALAALRSRVGNTSDRVHAQVSASIVVFGDLYGDRIDSAPYQFPITVCNDCVVAQDLGVCPAIAGTVPREGNPCNPFQDGLVDCCHSEAGDLICPAIVATE